MKRTERNPNNGVSKEAPGRGSAAAAAAAVFVIVFLLSSSLLDWVASGALGIFIAFFSWAVALGDET